MLDSVILSMALMGACVGPTCGVEREVTKHKVVTVVKDREVAPVRRVCAARTSERVADILETMRCCGSA